MAYEVEDEVDWSDSPLNPPSPAHMGCTSNVVPIYHSPVVEEESHDYVSLFDSDASEDFNPQLSISAPTSSSVHQSPAAEQQSQNYDPLFEPDTAQDFDIPRGIPLDTAARHQKNQPTISRAQCASLGIRLNRRMPSKEDYAHFALYQANQKAYEATFLKTFIAYALHRDRIGKCFSDVDSRERIEKYLATVSAEVNFIANKMVWNAHCPTVNLLAKDGKDGAPFLDVHSINFDVVSEIDHDRPTMIARKMNKSWHRVGPNLPMVRFSTREYPIGCHRGPLEEVDEVVNSLFHKDAFGKTLPTGHPTKAPGKSKGRGRKLPGAVAREEKLNRTHGDWLAFPSRESFLEQSCLSPEVHPRGKIDYSDMIFEPECGSQLIQDLSLQHNHAAEYSLHGDSDNDCSTPGAKLTQPKIPLDLHGSNAFDGNHASLLPEDNTDGFMLDISTLRKRLIKDHKSRMTLRSGYLPPHVPQTVSLGIQQAVAQAMAMGIYPLAGDYRDRLDIIIARERDLDCAREAERRRLAFLETLSPMEFTDTHANNGREFVHEPRPRHGDVTEKSSKRNKRKSKMINSIVPPSTQVPQMLRPHLGLETSRNVSNDGRKLRMAHSTNKQKTSMEPHRKKRKVSNACAAWNNTLESPNGPHPSGSKTLEIDQELPSGAYFERTSIDEEPAWRCGSNHALGYYYNAGRRKNCPGCNVSLSDNSKRVVMDFYLPARVWSYQRAPEIKWKPSKPAAKTRKSGRPCHNAIAKDAYWEARTAGKTVDEAFQHAIGTVTEYLEPKPKPRKEPTPEPTPEPEPDLGPHPSGSTIMEHGQELPECAYADPQEPEEALAWRCDVNHALGRYYLAGDKKSCPGCGTNKNGKGKQTVLDFYMPSGMVVRQEAPHLVKWKPRKYRSRKATSSTTKVKLIQNYSHNQMCTELYLQLLAQGFPEDEALVSATDATDKYLDEKNQESEYEVEDGGEDEGRAEGSSRERSVSHMRISGAPISAISHNIEPWSSNSSESRHNSLGGGCTISLIPQKRMVEDMDVEEELQYEPGEVIAISSDEEESSGSDSE